jgi:hypothetical protein
MGTLLSALCGLQRLIGNGGLHRGRIKLGFVARLQIVIPDSGSPFPGPGNVPFNRFALGLRISNHAPARPRNHPACQFINRNARLVGKARGSQDFQVMKIW